jgi:hydrogenase maturation protease
MNIEKVKSIADAVLYEGYILYPYRPSATKNQQRWNFGGVYPKKFSEMQKGTDAWKMQTQCLVEGDENTTLDIKIRFLQMIMRGVREPNADFSGNEEDIFESDFQGVQALQVGEQLFQSWQEAIEREFDIKTVHLNDLVGKTEEQKFTFEENQETEILKNEENKVGGIIVRTNEFIEGAVEISVEDLSDRELCVISESARCSVE